MTLVNKTRYIFPSHIDTDKSMAIARGKGRGWEVEKAKRGINLDGMNICRFFSSFI